MILSHYVGRPSPDFDVYGFKGDISADLNERLRKLVEKHPDCAPITAGIVADPKEKHGWALDLLHDFVKNKQTGGHDAFGGDPKDLIPLSRPSPVKLGLGWPSLYNGPHHPNIADAELPPPLKVKWTFTGEKEFPGSPTVADGRVYCGNNDKRLYCIDAASGKKLWDFLTGDLVESTPTLSTARSSSAPSTATSIASTPPRARNAGSSPRGRASPASPASTTSSRASIPARPSSRAASTSAPGTARCTASISRTARKSGRGRRRA